MKTPEKTEEVFAALRTPEVEALMSSRRAGDGTVQRIVRDFGISNVTVRRQLDKLHTQDRARIVAWTTSSVRAPIWATGAGAHAPKPEKKARDHYREYAQRYRAAAKAREEMGDDELRTPAAALRRIDDYLEQVRAAGPRSWCAALEAA